jgi:hypothetical protein
VEGIRDSPNVTLRPDVPDLTGDYFLSAKRLGPDGTDAIPVWHVDIVRSIEGPLGVHAGTKAACGTVYAENGTVLSADEDVGNALTEIHRSTEQLRPTPDNPSETVGVETRPADSIQVSLAWNAQAWCAHRFELQHRVNGSDWEPDLGTKVVESDSTPQPQSPHAVVQGCEVTSDTERVTEVRWGNSTHRGSRQLRRGLSEQDAPT